MCPRLRDRVAPPLRGLKGAHGIAHNSPLDTNGGDCRGPPLTPLRSGAASAGAEYAEGLLGQTVVLVDGPALAGLMIDYGVGVSTRQVYEIKAVDTDFFDE